MVGQQRAQSAIQFGIGIPHRGYNLFVMGPSGSGKHSLVQEFIHRKAIDCPPPDDWCYVNNFERTHCPVALSLPAGRGMTLQRGLAQVIEELHSAIPAAFESDEFRARQESIEEEFKHQQEELLNAIQQEADQHAIKLLRTPDGFAFAPTKDGEILDPDTFKALPDGQRHQLEHIINELQTKLRAVIEQMPKWAKKTRDRLRELSRETTARAVDHLIRELGHHFADLPDVLEYLDHVRQDITANAGLFRKHDDEAHSGEAQLSSLNRYKINLLIDHHHTEGAPVIFEDHPNLQNLIGRVEHLSQLGTLVTDFTLIKPGALHRANGGYLILEAQKVLTQPFVWDALKRVLRSGVIRIDSVGQMLSLISTVSLEPEPIPVSVKVVLLGERLLYYLLTELDPDFRELFKVVADFEEDLDRTPANHELFASFLATMIRRQQLRPFTREAVCRVIEHASRLAGDADRITTHLRSIGDLLTEADYWASLAGRTEVCKEDVQQAIDEHFNRHSRLYERIQQEISKNILRIDTEGSRTATINGLSVVLMDDLHFGHPVRITATARLGEGQVIDIEREVEMGGPIHSKGVLILSSYLGNRYARQAPLSLSASLVFEQSYGEVEGDSASLAELCVLLSALAKTPIKQSFAITGSVNQHGEVQAIGGVNEKIEGFFDICRLRGLTGEQAVIIPADNISHLMLRADVRHAVELGQFAIYAVQTVDEALTLLTGVEAGSTNADGEFPDDTLNARIEEELHQMAMVRHTYADMLKHPHEDDEDNADSEKQADHQNKAI